MVNSKFRAKALTFLKQQLQLTIIRGSCRSKLHAVWRNHVASGVFLIMQTLGVNESGYRKFAPSPNDCLAHGSTQQALPVVRKNDRRATRDLRFDSSKKRSLQLGGKFACLFDIDAKHLLPTAKNARLRNRGSVRRSQNCRCVDAGILHDFQKLAPIFVRADNSSQRHRAAEPAQIHRDVCRSAGDMRLVVEPDNRNRRFGRDPFDRAPQVAVQHQVAHYQNATAVETSFNDADNFLQVPEHGVYRIACFLKSACLIPLSRSPETTPIRRCLSFCQECSRKTSCPRLTISVASVG